MGCVFPDWFDCWCYFRGCNMNRFDEAKGVRKYIHYVHTRVKLIKADVLSVETNQYYFFSELLDYIVEFAKTHKLFFGFMLGKYDCKYCMNVLGCTERHTFRFLERQRKKFIEFIYEKENELSVKYPFSGEYKWLHEREVSN